MSELLSQPDKTEQPQDQQHEQPQDQHHEQKSTQELTQELTQESQNNKKHNELIGVLSVDISIKYVNEIVDTILDVLDDRKLSPVSIIRVVANCMKVAAKMKVSNHNKKKIVLAGLEKFIKEKSGLSDMEIEVVMAVVDSVVNDAIDTLADVSSGKLKLQKKLCFCL